MSLKDEIQFALNLLQKSDANDSVVISPLSISLALALVHAGAGGNSKEEIRNVIAEGSSDEQLLEYYKSVGEGLLTSRDVAVNLANRLFIRDNFKVKQTYLDFIEKNFAAKAVNLDFNDKTGSSKAVNDFINEATAGKIANLVKPNEFTQYTIAILINAIYFAGEWPQAFTESKTLLEFYVKDGLIKKVPFMISNGVRRAYVETDEVQMLSLNYKDDQFKFAIILPKEKFGLASFRDSLTNEKLLDLVDDLHDHLLMISIPKFKIEKETALTDILIAFGINEIFTDRANLNAISRKIKVSEVKHKAVIEIDEKGTKAAAATAVRFRLKKSAKGGGAPRPISFCADHPFLYFIFHGKHILFCGQYNA